MPEADTVQFESCSICLRTILRGEHVHDYVTPNGEREGVCSLCRDRAGQWEWIPAELAATLVRPAPRRRRGAALRKRLARVAERARPSRNGEPDAASGPAEPVPAGGRRRHAPEREPVAQPSPDPASRPPPAPAQPQEEPQAQEPPPPPPRPTPETRERRLRRAVERFNASDEARIVAGLCRSLGQPRAAVRDVSRRPPRVEVTIAWELSWYRWEVGLDGDADAIREVAKGDELSELGDHERRWNANVDEEGSLRLELVAASAPAPAAAPAGGEGGG